MFKVEFTTQLLADKTNTNELGATGLGRRRQRGADGVIEGWGRWGGWGLWPAQCFQNSIETSFPSKNHEKMTEINKVQIYIYHL